MNDGAAVAAAICDAVQRVQRGEPGATVADALARVPADSIGTFLHAAFGDAEARTALTSGLGASPGAASGIVVFDADAAMEAGDDGHDVILVRNETTPDDVLGMQASRGILTTRGGLTSHAAVVARGWGIPAVVGAASIVIDDAGMHVDGHLIEAGTEISIDGRSGEVFLGAAELRTADAPAELDTLLRWADRVRLGVERPVTVRANADNAADAAHARRLGAEGIGLCRTEHMFLAADRLPLVRRLILTDDPTAEAEALADLEVAQQADFETLLAEMDGLPVTVRLLDPPLHEFLPQLERLIVAEALDQLDDAGCVELAAVRRLHEVNPMIGTRGVRLGVVKPGVYQMQMRALFRAISSAQREGRTSRVEVMIPLVVDPSELQLARVWMAEAAAAVDPLEAVSVGAMIETPRAALVAAELAGVSDFFSFGTNDLTQLTFAFSRDDVGSRLIPEYVRSGLLATDPFDSLDQVGVGRLIEYACEKSRAVRPDLKIGVCGEQAGDPVSAKFFVQCGVDYVSCSPYRVPIARLAVAQGLLETGRVSAELLASIATTAADTGTDPAPQRSTPSPRSKGGADMTTEFVVLHALRIKGFAPADAVADIACLERPAVHEQLAALADAELCKHLEKRDLWQLTPAGRERHGELLAEVPESELAGLRQHYERFLEINVEFKELCNRWQMRGEDTNDHSDSAYDGERISELRKLHDDAAPVVAGFAEAVPRFGSYATRLADAATQTEAGETKMFTGVMCGSFHDVWMELHEDLVQLLAVDRHAEGSY